MKYIGKEERALNKSVEVYNRRKLLDIIDEIGDEIFFLLNDSNSLFVFRDRLNSMVVSTKEGNRVYDIIRRLVNRMADFVRNADEISCDTLEHMSIKRNMTYEEMASELDCSTAKIRDLIYKCQLYKGSAPEEQYNISMEEVKHLMDEGKTKKEIAKHFGCSISALNKRIRRFKFDEEKDG